MATVQTLLNRSGRMLGVLASNTAMGSDESADALVALNDFIDSIRNNEGLTYARQSESLTLSASTASYTIGPTGTLVTTRPVAIEQAWIEDSNNTYDVIIIEDDEYNAIPDKTTNSSWPDRVNYRASMSNGTLYVYPRPDATRTLKLMTRVVVAEFSAVTDTVTLPPGWRLMLTANLAIAIAPEYPGVVVSSELRKLATESLASVKRANSKPIKAYTELGDLLQNRHVNILTGS